MHIHSPDIFREKKKKKLNSSDYLQWRDLKESNFCFLFLNDCVYLF